MADNPTARFPDMRSLGEDCGAWCVAHLKSRQEKAFAHDLRQWGISYYMPLIEKRTRRSDNGKIRKSLLPLFPGYLAVAIPWQERECLYQTRRLANLLPVDDQEQFISELEGIRRALDSDVRVELAPNFELGQRVRVNSGPMLGLEGEVVQYRGETMFIIKVNMFQQAIRVELDEFCLDAI
ncbi:MAG: hypothetical protein JXR97_02635 [Planctomycetes bacterium]|nr:hypothetical protein [Planctomycetota bacterium]